MANTFPPSRNWSSYQQEIYENGMTGVNPNVTTNPKKLQNQAKGYLADGPFNYVAGGAGNNDTMDANRRAFRYWSVGCSSLRPFVWNTGSTLAMCEGLKCV